MNLLINELDKYDRVNQSPQTIYRSAVNYTTYSTYATYINYSNNVNPIQGADSIKRADSIKSIVKSINNMYDKNYSFNKKHYTSYLDIDHCDDGFNLHAKPLVKLRKKQVIVNSEIASLDDLIRLTYDYPLSEYLKYDINIAGIHKIKEHLIELNNFIGLEDLKENLLDQLIYFMHENGDDYLHTVLYGPPGTGKTEIAKILGNIYTKLGILKKGTFIKVTRSDFIAGYLGQTAIKTRKLIEDNLGGVIFIDEAYAMGNQEKKDSFSKEALDTLCELLSNHKKELMVIIAGYREELNSCFFSYNPGLVSRFAWQFEIEKYSPEQLKLIFHKKVKDAGWYTEENVASIDWFRQNIDSFKNYGRDMENLFSKCKICNFRRLFGKKPNKHILSMKDLEKGYDKFIKYNSSKNKKESPPNFMYS